MFFIRNILISPFFIQKVAPLHCRGSASSIVAMATVWCGMADGKVRVFDAGSWQLQPNYVQASDR